MIVESKGNLLEAEAEALVNTVNTVGVMGKGIALQFKRAFPENYAIYERQCKAGNVQPGRVLVVKNHALGGPRYIINFPTKRHWRGSARLEDIDAGLLSLVEEVKRRLKMQGIHTLDLNVNRHNKAREFYEKLGFAVIQEEDVPIGPYWMNDYVMRLSF